MEQTPNSEQAQPAIDTFICASCGQEVPFASWKMIRAGRFMPSLRTISMAVIAWLRLVELIPVTLLVVKDETRFRSERRLVCKNNNFGLQRLSSIC